MKRTIERVFRGSPEHWVGNGFHVSNYFPGASELEKRMSPFFLLDYQAPRAYAPAARPPGVGPHPHRGLETVTIAYQGAIEHHDSTGQGGVIRPDEVQWMTAGSGLLHKEHHEQGFARTGGVLQMMQIWVNLPRAHKRTEPRYQALTRTEIPEVTLAGGAGLARVIAGSFAGQTGKASTFTPVELLDLRLEAGARVRLEAPREHNTALLVLDGSLAANDGPRATDGELVLFRNDGDEIDVSAESRVTALYLSGAPIEEPLVHYGPFLMNTVDEINEAVDDFNAGKFGELH